MRESTLRELIGAAYDAVELDSWSAFLERFVAALRADAGVIGEWDPGTGKQRVASAGFDPSHVSLLCQHVKLDPYSPVAITLPPGSPVLGDTLVPPAVAAKTPYVNELILPFGFRPSASICILEKSGTILCAVTTQYKKHRSDHAIEGQLPDQRLVLPHLRTAMRLQRRLRQGELERSALLGALDMSGSPVAVCDGRGFVLTLNRSAELLLAACDGLGYRDGRLVVHDGRDARSFGRSLQAACRLGEGRGTDAPGFVRTCRPSGKRPYELLVAPVPERTVDVRRDGGRAYVFFYDPENQALSSSAALRALYGLTDQEAQVTLLLARGLSVRELGERLCIRRETVKSHLEAVFHKTDTRRQGELVAQVLRGLARIHGHVTDPPAKPGAF